MKLSFLIQLVFLIIFILGVYLVFTNNVNGRNKLILIVVCLVIAIYLFINLPFFKDHDDLIETPADAKQLYNIDTSTLKSSNGEPFGLSMWIYVDDWSYKYGHDKNILKYSDGDNELRIYLDKNKNDLIIQVPRYMNDTEHADAISAATGSDIIQTNTNEEITIENINLQKWVCITLTMSTRTIDVYLNGKLVKSHPFNNVIQTKFNDGNIEIADGFGGFISKVGYYPYFITPTKSWSIYKDGLGSSFLSALDRYGMTLTFLEDQQVKGTYEVF